MTANPATGHTRWLMMLSAVAAGAVALIALFAPDELLSFAGAAPTAPLAAVVQLWAGALGGLAMVNWMSRENLIGGIYNRPLLIANVFHSVVGVTTLVRLAADEGGRVAIAGAVIYGLLAAAFGRLLFRSPV